MRKKVISLVLAILLVASIAPTGFAAGEISPFYLHADSVSVSLSISGGTADCTGKIRPKGTGTTAAVTVRLQQKVNGVWKSISSWDNTGTGLTVVANGSTSISKGYSYRVTVSGTIKDSSGTIIEHVSKTSATKDY